MASEGRWQPIETAPRDGTPVLLLFDDGLMEVGRHYGHEADHHNGWWSNDGLDYDYGLDNPTHWMPLPEPPHAAD